MVSEYLVQEVETSQSENLTEVAWNIKLLVHPGTSVFVKSGEDMFVTGLVQEEQGC